MRERDGALPAATFSARLIDSFRLTGRGCVLVLDPEFTGCIDASAKLRLGDRTLDILAVETVSRRDARGRLVGHVALVVDEEHAGFAVQQTGKPMILAQLEHSADGGDNV